MPPSRSCPLFNNGKTASRHRPVLSAHCGQGCSLYHSQHQNISYCIATLVGVLYRYLYLQTCNDVDRIVTDINSTSMARADRRRERQEFNATLQDHKPAVLEASRRLQSAMSMPKANNVPCENQVSGRLEEVVAPQGGSASRDVLISTPGMPAKVLTTM